MKKELASPFNPLEDSGMVEIGGIEKCSFSDYPFGIAFTVFLQGCPIGCPYCHNPSLQLQSGGKVSVLYVLEEMKTRRNQFDIVIISGGEPLIQGKLPQFISEIKNLGIPVGLHTTGANPFLFDKCLPMLDWVGLDIKAPFDEYDLITRSKRYGDNARKCLSRLIEEKKRYEVRTTWDTRCLTPEDIGKIQLQLKEMGVSEHTIQFCRVGGKKLSLPAFPGHLPTKIRV